jgi:hypothetical protein
VENDPSAPHVLTSDDPDPGGTKCTDPGGIALHVTGAKLALPLPPAGTLHVTVGLRDPSASVAGNRCGAVTSTLQNARKGAPRFH